MNTPSPRTTSLLQPTLLGMLLFLLFTWLCNQPGFQNPLIQRYMFGHPINRISGLLFFVGVAAVALAAWDVWRQRRSAGMIQQKLLARTGVDASSEAGGQEREAEVRLARELQKKLAGISAGCRSHYLFQRIQSVLEVVERDGATPALHARLAQLADDDLDRQSQRFAFPRILVWAIPLLGFLGTVLGISAAMGQLNVGAESDLQQMMGGLQSNLNVAFDTTAQALVLSIVLMFGVFAIERNESQLQYEVTHRCESVICSWFELSSDGEAAPKADNLAAAGITGELALQFGHLAEIMEREFSRIPQGIQAQWERTTQSLVDQLALQHAALTRDFEKVATQPTAARRIEAALVQLTSAVGELQRQLNHSRPDAVLSPPILPLERIAPQHRKAA